VLDLGCGQGWFSRQLAAQGAQVVGVDVSRLQLTNALRHEEEHSLGITNIEADATRTAELWEPATFDLVTACMVPQDLPDAAAVLAASRRVLTFDGRFLFSISHPVTDAPFRQWERDAEDRPQALRIDRYYESGPRVVHWNMARLTAHWDTPAWNRTLSEWSDLFLESDFVVRQLTEPIPTAAQVEQDERLEPARRIPFLLIFELVPTTK
jgi:SAM-dependent methyltransferase